MAGESAREVARRRREKAERLNRMADAYERGAQGEEATAQALKALPRDWVVMHDVRWPGRRFANIDHVVIGPPGVFVIDSKLWSGTVTVINDVLRQNGYKRETAVAGVADSAIAVAELVPGLDPYLVKPVLCFVRDQEVTGTVRDVLVCSTANLVAALTARASLLDATGRHNVHAWLSRSLQSASAPPPVRNWPPPARKPPARKSPVRRLPREARVRPGPAALKSCMALLVLAVVAVLGVGLVISVLGHVRTELNAQARPPSDAGPDGPSSLAVGDAARFGRGTGRPPLRVVVDRVGTTRSTEGLKPYLPGDRLFAVRLKITNVGRHRWISQPGTSATILDALGVGHRASSRYAVVRAGRSFPAVIRLKPRHSLRRVLVFEVQVAQPVTSFSLTVGPGQPRTATWTIDRQ